MTAPGYLPVLVLGMSIFMTAATLYGLNQALVRKAWPDERRRRVLRIAAVLLIGWLAAALALSLADTFKGGPGRIPTIQYGFLIPVAIAALLMWRSQTVAGIVEAVPQHWLIGVQVTRAIGAVFLVLYVAGLMPGLFAWPAGVGDLAVAGLAPVVAYAAARDPQGSFAWTNRSIAAWNLLGLIDFMGAFVTGFATARSPFQMAAFDNPNALIAVYPLVLIPVFLVPLMTIFHMVSLTKLRRATALRQAIANRSA